MVHLIAIDLNGVRLPDEMQEIERVMRGLGEAYAFQRTAWVVESELSNREIGERLSQVLRPKDRLLVTRIHRDWSAANIADAEQDFLSTRNYASASDPPLFPTARPQR